MAGEDTAKIHTIWRRQEVLIEVVKTLAETMAVTDEKVSRLMEWMKEPGSTELPDLLRAVVTTLGDLKEAVEAMPENIVEALKPTSF